MQEDKLPKFGTAISTKFRKLKDQFNVLNHASKLCFNHLEHDDVGTGIINHIANSKKEISKSISQLESELLSAQEVNVQQLGDTSWYSIMYLDRKNKKHLLFHPLVPSYKKYILRESWERDLSRNDLDNLLPLVQDEDELEVYGRSIHSSAVKYLSDSFGVSITEEKEEEGEQSKSIRTTIHARRRWAERVLGVSMDQSEAYQRRHAEEINNQVLDEINNRAEKIWTGEDGTEYWFSDATNIMFLTGQRYEDSSKDIITLYEQDFGFSKDINNSIVHKQIEEISKSYDELVQSKEEYNNNREKYRADIDHISDEIDVLKSKIDELLSEKDLIESKVEYLSKGVDTARKQYEAECNKLFKKWKEG